MIPGCSDSVMSQDPGFSPAPYSVIHGLTTSGSSLSQRWWSLLCTLYPHPGAPRLTMLSMAAKANRSVSRDTQLNVPEAALSPGREDQSRNRLTQLTGLFYVITQQDCTTFLQLLQTVPPARHGGFKCPSLWGLFSSTPPHLACTNP